MPNLSVAALPACCLSACSSWKCRRTFFAPTAPKSTTRISNDAGFREMCVLFFWVAPKKLPLARRPVGFLEPNALKHMNAYSVAGIEVAQQVAIISLQGF